MEAAPRMNPRRRLWLLVRVAIYLSVIVGLLLYRGGVPWKSYVAALKGAGKAHPTLTIAGRDLAPPLLERLVVEYQHDYPQLSVNLLPGGTNHALEALLAGGADVAFSYRNLTDREQALFREADGDTAIVLAVGVGGLVLLQHAGREAATITTADLREALAAVAAAPAVADPALAPFCGRLYVCDPNEGSWDALFAALGLAAPGGDDAGAGSGLAAPRLGQVTFLADPASVIAAVAASPDAWGLASTLDAGLDVAAGSPAGTRFVGVVAEAGQEAVAPGAASIATGVYPLHHFLYVACRGAGNFEGGKFVTHLASARGLRQVERAGVIPARLVARTIQLSRDPVGGGDGGGNP
jgi:ABC-type phosphate transport system substrate-binding protein